MGHPHPVGRSRQPDAGRRFGRALTALILFAIAFGYVEAAVVVYLRVSYEPLHQRLYLDQPASDLFPILAWEQLEAAGPEYVQRLYTELAREGATLVMLAGVALAVAHNVRQWFAAFMIAFSVWDIFFYVFLWVLIGWPASLFDWDLLFLLPLPWVGPVLAPVVVSLSMVVAGCIILWRELADRPLRLTAMHWTTILSAGVLLVAAFCWDFRNILHEGLPNPFNWPLFAFGELVGIAAFLHALRRSASNTEARLD